MDPSVAQALTARMGERGGQLLDRLLDTWEAETDQRLNELGTAVEAGNARAVGRVAHAMRGGSGSLGAVELAATVDARAGLTQLRVGSTG